MAGLTKDELIQLHALFTRIRNRLDERPDVVINRDAFETYDQLGISPLHVYRNSAEQKKALVALAEALERAFDAEPRRDREARRR